MIVIIGAGIAGLSLGYELVKCGEEITILEADKIASGASGIATSYLEPRLGNTAMRAIEREAMQRWEDYAHNQQTRSKINVGFNKSGQIKVSLPGDLAKLEKDLKARERQNVPFQRLDTQAIKEAEPSLSPGIISGAFLPDVRWVNGKAICLALAQSVIQAGGQIIEQHPVASIEVTKNKINLLGGGGSTIDADKIVLCNGMGANTLAGLPLDIPQCRAVRGVNLVLDQSALANPITHLIKHHRGNLCPRANDQLIVGTTYESGVSSLTPEADIVEFLYQNAEPILPSIRELPLINVTAGIRSKIGDGNLRLGRSNERPNVYYSLSHGGAGFLRAPAVAPKLAQFIQTGEKPELLRNHIHG